MTREEIVAVAARAFEEGAQVTVVNHDGGAVVGHVLRLTHSGFEFFARTAFTRATFLMYYALIEEVHLGPA